MIRFKLASAWNISFGKENSCESPWFADLTTEESTRCLRWWRKFRILSRISWLGMGLILVAYLGGRYSHSDSWVMLVPLALLLIVTTSVWLRIFNCPRCGVTYSGGLISILNRSAFLDHCYGCDLTTKKLAELEKYAGSFSEAMH